MLLLANYSLRGESIAGRHLKQNPIVELHAQDRAFTLATVAYRELQTYMIERDYETRLAAGATLANPRRQAEVFQLATQERDLRLQKLSNNLTNLNTTYSYARGGDERRMSVSVPLLSDTTAAARQLHEMVILAPGKGDRATLKTIPVNELLGPLPPTQINLPHVALLRQAAGEVAGLTESVDALLQSSAAAREVLQRDPSLPVVVSYRLEKGSVTGVVAQIFSQSLGKNTGLLDGTNAVTKMLDGDLVAHLDQLLGRLSMPAIMLGEPAEVQRRQRLWQATLVGDVHGLAETSAAPLRIAILLPAAGKLMPSSLRDRVKAVVVQAELSQPQWRGSVTLVASDDTMTEQVARVMASWQLLLGAWPAGGGGSSPLAIAQAAGKKVSIEMHADCVRLAGALPAELALKIGGRLADKLHGRLTKQTPEISVASLQARK